MHVTDTQNVVELIDLLAFPMLPMHIDLSTNQKNKQLKFTKIQWKLLNKYHVMQTNEKLSHSKGAILLLFFTS